MTEQDLDSNQNDGLPLLLDSKQRTKRENAELKTQPEDGLDESIERWEQQRGSNHL